MCQFKSCIILKDRVFVPDYDRHSRMLEELNISDTFENASSVFVRAEISPTDGNVFSDVTGWKLNVDQDILPDWYVPEIDESRAKNAVSEWMKNHTISGGEREVRDGVWFATGSATVTAWNSATVKAYSNATVTAYDSATVKAYSSATVTAWNSATVTAYDIATVTAYGSATVTAYGSATVTAYDSATVTAYGSATVIIPNVSFNKLDNVTVNDNAIAICKKTNQIKSNTKWKMKE
jgi:hypothetical protein